MKKIKCFIFDQDGTFYPEKSELTNALREKTKEWLMNRLSLSRKEIEKLYRKLPKEYPTLCPNCKSAYWDKPARKKK